MVAQRLLVALQRQRQVALVEAVAGRLGAEVQLAAEHQRIGIAMRRRLEGKAASRSETRESMTQEA